MTIQRFTKSRAVNEIRENNVWEFLLMIRNYVKGISAYLSDIIAVFNSGQFELIRNKPAQVRKNSQGILITNTLPDYEFPGYTVFHYNPDTFNFSLCYDNFLGTENCGLVSLYLPVCFLPLLAKRNKRTAAILHFAQTLDGRIATVSGNSKWIGNNANLVHAHRMRALCDGVLIGANTLRVDKPQLTVRHVQGPNPLKIVVGNNSVEFNSLLANGGKVLYFSSSGKNGYDRIEHVRLNSRNNQIAPERILKELFARSIYSLYVEGGSITASHFLRDRSANFMQLFVAPKIFGSGISNFSLPEINGIENSIEFHHFSFVPMGDGILFSGALKL